MRLTEDLGEDAAAALAPALTALNLSGFEGLTSLNLAEKRLGEDGGAPALAERSAPLQSEYSL